MIHLYAIALGLRAVPPGRGLEDAPLEHTAVAGLDLVVSAHHAGVAASEESILRHAQVVDAVMTQSDAVLPARLGRDFRDHAALAAAVEQRADELRDALARVAGCVELGLRVVAPQPAGKPQRSDGARAYMVNRLAQVAAMDEVVNSVHEPLARKARDSVRRSGATSQLVLSAAYLVPVDDVEAFRDEIATLEQAHPGLSVICSGPWPPYSFAGSTEVSV